jgi:hypothetical protein
MGTLPTGGTAVVGVTVRVTAHPGTALNALGAVTSATPELDARDNIATVQTTA